MEGIGAAGIEFALLGTFLAASVACRRRTAWERHWPRVLGALAVLGLLVYLGSVRVQPSVNRIHVHHWDVYHYYVGAKYFAELGQGGLYEATVVADWEDDRDGFRAALPIRDLRDSAHEIRRADVLPRAAEIKRRFAEPGRWREFKNDVAYFRAADPERWRSSLIQRDHGYNGTPLVTAGLGALANWNPGGTAVFVAIAVWLDLLCVIAVAVWIALRIEPACGLAFAFFWFANPLNDYDFTGGGFLRHAYLVALACGFALYRKGSRGVAGAWLAVASCLRIFPVVFPLALLARDVIGTDRRGRLRENRRFYATFAATASVVIAATSWQATPEGRNAWLEQVDQVGSREALQSPNGISLRFPFLYSGDHSVAVVLDAAARGQTIDWVEATDRTFAARLPFYLGTLALLAAIGVAFVRRAGATEAMFAGLVALYGLLIVSHYYYALLAIVPIWFRDRRALEVLAVGSMAVIVSDGLAAGEAIDLRFAWSSAIVGVTLAWILLLRWFDARPSGVPKDASA